MLGVVEVCILNFKQNYKAIIYIDNYSQQDLEITNYIFNLYRNIFHGT